MFFFLLILKVFSNFLPFWLKTSEKTDHGCNPKRCQRCLWTNGTWILPECNKEDLFWYMYTVICITLLSVGYDSRIGSTADSAHRTGLITEWWDLFDATFNCGIERYIKSLLRLYKGFDPIAIEYQAWYIYKSKPTDISPFFHGWCYLTRK